MRSLRPGGVDHLREILIILAIGAAEALDRRQLLLGEVDLALEHIGFAEIFAYLGVARIERDRLQIIGDAFIGPAELACRIAAIVEGSWRIGVLEQIEN